MTHQNEIDRNFYASCCRIATHSFNEFQLGLWCFNEYLNVWVPCVLPSDMNSVTVERTSFSYSDFSRDDQVTLECRDYEALYFGRWVWNTLAGWYWGTGYCFGSQGNKICMGCRFLQLMGRQGAMFIFQELDPTFSEAEISWKRGPRGRGMAGG